MQSFLKINQTSLLFFLINKTLQKKKITNVIKFSEN